MGRTHDFDRSRPPSLCSTDPVAHSLARPGGDYRGLAHRLHRLHPAAQTLDYAALTTLDADVALPIELKVEGQDIYKRLQANGFQAQFLGEHKPPATHYHLIAEHGEFYAEFLTPLVGGAHERGGKSKGTTQLGGVVTQNLRHLELLLHAPWTVILSRASGFPLEGETSILVANPASFISQKLLIQGKRNREERAKDTLYIHDTLENIWSHSRCFASRLAGENCAPVTCEGPPASGGGGRSSVWASD
jgi:hypothetical protein